MTPARIVAVARPIVSQWLAAQTAELELRSERDRHANVGPDRHDLVLTRVSPPHLSLSAHEQPYLLDRAMAHGDVVVWGGPARFTYHGVAPLKEAEHPLTGSERINLTFRKVF